RLRAFGIARDERAERRDRLAVLAQAVLRIAEPEQRRLAVAARGPALAQRAQTVRGRLEVAPAQRLHRIVVLLLLVDLGAELLAVERDLLRLEAAHAVVDARLDVLLLALQLGQVACKLLVGAAQFRVLGAQLLEL